ncbi:MAG: 7-bisphosphate phosphatase [Verrucomicrobia bacterium]|nr:MAG: 7-bisphosphate phosphatase [Verrucomicrobiota bacterium]
MIRPSLSPAVQTAAVFVDRDGTLNEMVFDPVHGTLDSPRRSAQVVAMRHAGAFLEGLRALGYKIVVVTNQPGLSKGTLTNDDLVSVNDRLSQVVQPGAWDSLRFCPHHPEYGGDCNCRKPKPGMLTETSETYGIDLGKSWMVGDGLVDIQAGKAAGCRTVLVTKLTMNMAERFFDFTGAEPDFIAADLLAALDIIRANHRASTSCD